MESSVFILNNEDVLKIILKRIKNMKIMADGKMIKKCCNDKYKNNQNRIKKQESKALARE